MKRPPRLTKHSGPKGRSCRLRAELMKELCWLEIQWDLRRSNQAHSFFFSPTSISSQKKPGERSLSRSETEGLGPCVCGGPCGEHHGIRVEGGQKHKLWSQPPRLPLNPTPFTHPHPTPVFKPHTDLWQLISPLSASISMFVKQNKNRK